MIQLQPATHRVIAPNSSTMSGPQSSRCSRIRNHGAPRMNDRRVLNGIFWVSAIWGRRCGIFRILSALLPLATTALFALFVGRFLDRDHERSLPRRCSFPDGRHLRSQYAASCGKNPAACRLARSLVSSVCRLRDYRRPSLQSKWLCRSSSLPRSMTDPCEELFLTVLVIQMTFFSFKHSG